VSRHGTVRAAFLVRYEGVAHGFINQCAHKLVELDWEPGNFFDTENRYLICSTHGALYEPASGLCVEGPCRGANLFALSVVEHDGAVFLQTGNGVDLSLD
jgi:nitrite reductase/ring-hydroxylating ferredoxin subunit